MNATDNAPMLQQPQDNSPSLSQRFGQWELKPNWQIKIKSSFPFHPSTESVYNIFRRNQPSITVKYTLIKDDRPSVDLGIFIANTILKDSGIFMTETDNVDAWSMLSGTNSNWYHMEIILLGSYTYDPSKAKYPLG